MTKIHQFINSLAMPVKLHVVSAQRVAFPLIKRVRTTIKQSIFTHVDQQLDQLFAILNQFRRYQLYRHPSRVTINEMTATEDAFLRLADQNRQGENMSLRDSVIFLVTLYRIKFAHAKTLDHMVTDLNIHALLRHAFGLS